MSKEEILDYFKDINHAYNDCTKYDTLKRMLDELQELCDDAISRQAVLSLLQKHVEENPDTWMDSPWDITPRQLMREINNLPPVTTEKVGYWISNAWDDLKISDYCPKCGSYNGGAD